MSLCVSCNIMNYYVMKTDMFNDFVVKQTCISKNFFSGQVVMAVAWGPLLAAVLLLVSTGHHCSSLPPACPEPCTCQRAPLVNCSSSGLSLVPQHIRDSVTELDLSHNLLSSVALDRPHRDLRAVWLGNNSITHLSLCVERAPGGPQLLRVRPWSRQGCESWAPTLQLLSVERNQLEQLPEGESELCGHTLIYKSLSQHVNSTITTVPHRISTDTECKCL